MKTKTKKIEKPKYLFIDFDGVCTSFEEGSYLTNPLENYGPSKKICERIKQLCKETNTKIIISSNWRKFEDEGYCLMDGKKYKNPLGKLKDILGDYIIGTLPKIKYVTKAEALILWMEENDFDYKNEKWAIVDDDPRENLGTTYDNDIKYHYIQTNPKLGLTYENIEALKTIFLS